MRLPSFHRVPPVSLAAALTVLVSPAASQTLYVDAALTTGAGDGSSWGNAFQGTNGLQAALGSGQAFTDIYVADGVYRTAAGTVRGVAFSLAGEVRLFGGFAGGEAHPDERPPFGSAPTILSGDLLGDDVHGDASTRGDNAYHVLRASGGATLATVDGFTITGGNANGFTSFRDVGGGAFVDNAASLTIRNCTFEGANARRDGGGVYGLSATLDISDTRFEACTAGGYGGAIASTLGIDLRIERSVLVGNRGGGGGGLAAVATENTWVTDSVFLGNEATDGTAGGGMYLSTSGRAHVIGCTVAQNTSPQHWQAGIHVNGAWATVRNSILWGNVGENGAQASTNQMNAGVDTEYCIVEGGYAGTGCQGADPLFTDAPAGDLRPMSGSPAIDAGDGAWAGLGDVNKRRRDVDDPLAVNLGSPIYPGSLRIVDIGAHERSSGIGTIECEARLNSSGSPGRLDIEGSPRIQDHDVTLVVSRMPNNSFGYFLVSVRSGFSPFAGGSAGNLCLGGSIGRYVGPGQIMSSGQFGGFALAIDLNAIPTPTGPIDALPGDSLAFQLWFRESNSGVATSNFTDVTRLRFE